MSKLNTGESKMNLSQELGALILHYGLDAVKNHLNLKGEQKITLDGNSKLITKLNYKDTEIKIDLLRHSVKCDSTVGFPYCSMQDVLVVEITIKGLVKNNPKAELLFHFNEPLSKNTVIGVFYDNAIEYAKFVINELKSGN